MKKGTKLFLKIIYYGFTFGLGILLALVLPGLKYYEKLAYEMEYNLNNEMYADAMCLIGGYYDSKYAYQEDFEDESGIVIFRAATLIHNDENAKQEYSIHITYSGFLYCANDKYLVQAIEDNQTMLVVTNLAGETINIDLLNEDTNDDEVLDSISTLRNGGSYVYFEIPHSKTTSVTKLEFKDRENKLFKSVEPSLDYNHDFFKTVEPFINVYNNNSGDSQLKELNEEITKSYEIGTYGNIKAEAEKDATIFVLIYFIWIYILGDILVGRRYIIKFFKWIYRKITKKEKDTPTEEEKNQVYGTDYYTQLTIRAIVPKNCDVPIMISYSNESYQISLILNNDEGYEQKARVHAGSYFNAKAECTGYEVVDLPQVLSVRGFKMELEVNIKKIDEINEN